MSKLVRNALLAGIVLATLLVYWAGLYGGYILDDRLRIITNADVQIHALTWHQLHIAMRSEGGGLLGRPLSYASFALNYYFTGLQPFWMKLTNVIIHLGNGILLFGLLRAILFAAKSNKLADADSATRRDWLALLVTAAWLMAPINVTAVLYVVQRMESAANLFVFGGLWMYVAGRWRQMRGMAGGGWRIGVGIIGGTAIGVLFKEDAALLPLYAFLLEWILFDFRSHRAVARSRGLFAFYGVFLLVPALVGTWLIRGVLTPVAWAIRDFTLRQRLLTEARVVVDYAHWTLLPILNQLSFFHDDLVISRGLLTPAWTLAAILVLLCAVIAIFALRRRKPLVSLGIAWFLAAQLMTGTFIPLELVFEHRNYFASSGLLLALFSAIMPLEINATRLRTSAAILAVLTCFYAGTTAMRAAEWGNPLRLAYSESQKNPASARSRYYLGQVQTEMSEYRGGSHLLALGIATLKQAAAIPGSSILPEETLIYANSRAYPARPIDPELWKSIEQKLRGQLFSAENLSALYGLTSCAIKQICIVSANEMVPVYLTAIRASPNDPQILIMYANYATFALGDLKLARDLLQGAVKLSPGNQQYRDSLQQVEAQLRAPTNTPQG